MREEINITDDTLHFAVIHGLRSPIRLHVLQQGVQDLEHTLRAARIAEASTATDPLTALLLETIKTTTQAAEKQAAEIKDLSMKVSALSANWHHSTSGIYGQRPTRHQRGRTKSDTFST
jgi:hypothetical protein